MFLLKQFQKNTEKKQRNLKKELVITLSITLTIMWINVKPTPNLHSEIPKWHD
jgi:hypothetical protein